MERLTRSGFDYCAEYCVSSADCGFFKREVSTPCEDAAIYNRLAAYEDTGLEPEEVFALQRKRAMINNPLRGIYIRGATMPEICEVCPLCNEYHKCSITGSDVFYHDTDRAADCPIVETEEEPEIRLYDKEKFYHG